MKLQMTRGCICDSLTVDGKPEIELSELEKRHCKNLIFSYLGLMDLNYLLQLVLENFGEYSATDKPCECCGDIIENFELEI